MGVTASMLAWPKGMSEVSRVNSSRGILGITEAWQASRARGKVREGEIRRNFDRAIPGGKEDVSGKFFKERVGKAWPGI
eukprot:562266-Pelagomonas_calceolata.AAC.4